MTYYDKYVKYKTKYLKLKRSSLAHQLALTNITNIGGAIKEIICVNLEEINVPEVFHSKLVEMTEEFSKRRAKFNEVTDKFSSVNSQVILNDKVRDGIFTFKTDDGMYEAKAIPYITYIDGFYYFSWIRSIINSPKLKQIADKLQLQYAQFINEYGLDYLKFDCFKEPRTQHPVTYDMELIMKHLTGAIGKFTIANESNGHILEEVFMITDYVKL
jgi:hypothetical protein